LEMAVEEERLNRIKHWAGFPAASVAAVLAGAGARLADVEHVAISRDPRRRLGRKLLFILRHRPRWASVRSRLVNLRQVRDLRSRLGETFVGTVHNVEHHRAHLASAFFCSPFEEAACLTVDGFGDFVSSMSAAGRGNTLRPLDAVPFPHSLGVFYTAVTQVLGFPRYGDEYKVMALASFGSPSFLPALRRMVRLAPDGRYETDSSWFSHASEGVSMSWSDGEPTLGPLFSRRMAEALGGVREPGAPLLDRHHDVAASLQAMYEEALFHRLDWLQRTTGARNLCLAGGCALNSVANGRITERTGFREVFVQPAAGDAGTALGAAQYVWHQVLDQPRRFTMEHAYWGPGFSDAQLLAALCERLPGFRPPPDGEPTRVDDVVIRRVPREDDLLRETAAVIARGGVVGWYQGRSEWGPRALGNRSIVADPRREEMRGILNERVKRREPFRPFAPAILEECVTDYFDGAHPDPFMVMVRAIRPERRADITAAAHVDGTGRLQTVSRAQNPRFWGLIKAFEAQTGVPVLVNTSFNENEPIVNAPAEAVDCFLRTKMHRLVLGDWVVDRVSDGGAPLD
jgi:carbamoyltransferase